MPRPLLPPRTGRGPGASPATSGRGRRVDDSYSRPGAGSGPRRGRKGGGKGHGAPSTPSFFPPPRGPRTLRAVTGAMRAARVRFGEGSVNAASPGRRRARPGSGRRTGMSTGGRGTDAERVASPRGSFVPAPRELPEPAVAESRVSRLPCWRCVRPAVDRALHVGRVRGGARRPRVPGARGGAGGGAPGSRGRGRIGAGPTRPRSCG